MSHPCDKYPALDFPWERTADRAINQMNLSKTTAARKRKRRDEDKLTDRWPKLPNPATPEAQAFQAGLSFRAGTSGKGRGRPGERKTLHYMPERVRPTLTQRRYTSWLPERSDKVTKHEQKLALIAKLLWRGWSTPRIAKVLNLAPRTARENVQFLLNYGRKQQIRRKPAKSRTSLRGEYSYAAD